MKPHQTVVYLFVVMAMLWCDVFIQYIVLAVHMCTVYHNDCIVLLTEGDWNLYIVEIG